jgi:SAM-dependent methyltransferase
MSSHDDQVTRQFGPAAADYLTSSVHVQGADLAALGRKFQGRSSARVLDLGCGAGHLSFAVASHVRAVMALDLSVEMLGVVVQEAQARGLDNIDTCQGAAEELPFPGQSFEYVCTRYSAHHWASVPRALTEIRRVLKTGGALIIIDVLAPSTPLLDTYLQTIELLRDPSHVRNYSRDNWNAYSAAAGFQIDEIVTWNLRLEFQSWVTRMRTPRERIALIRELLLAAPEEVRDYLKIEADGSFQIDAAMLEISAISKR